MNNYITKAVENVTGKIFNKEKQKQALCNDVYFIDAKNGSFIIKIAKDKIRQMELDKEYKIINKINKDINLPKIYKYVKDENVSFIIMEYILGNKPTNFTDDVLQKMATTLKKIHSYNLSNKFVDFDNFINIAEQNMNNNRLDLDEFVKESKFFEPKQILTYLKENKPKAKSCLLHGDFRPKNMLIKNNDLFILDWGLSFIGDCYYDLAIIKWYFTDDEFSKFVKYYGIKKLDKKRLEYNEWLSAFLNV